MALLLESFHRGTRLHYFRSGRTMVSGLVSSAHVPTSTTASRTSHLSLRRHHGWSVVKTTERGGIRGFDAHKRVKGRKRHMVVDIFGLLIACRV